MGKKKRKVRSDKKKDVKPTVSVELHDCISRISYITNTPMKDVAEFICVQGLFSREVLDVLSPNFRRNFSFGNILYIGDLHRTQDRSVKKDGAKKRLTIRFRQEDYDRLAELAHALDVTVSSAVSILLETAIKNRHIIDAYFTSYIHQSLDPSRKEQFKAVEKFIQKENPFQEDISFLDALHYIREGVVQRTRHLKQTLEDWVENRSKEIKKEKEGQKISITSWR